MSRYPIINTVVKPGSDNYYAMRKLSSDSKQAITVVLALFEIIFQLPFTLSDDHLVRIKLRWWKEELLKTERGKTSHPVCLALFPIMKKYGLHYNALLQAIDSLENIVQQCQFPTEQSLRDFYTYTYGIRERMIAKIMSTDASSYANIIHHGAYVLALIDNLKQIRQRTLKAYIFFSDEEAGELEVDKNTVLTLTISDPLRKLFEKQIKKAREHYQYLINNDNQKNQSRELLQPLIIRCRLGLKWCELISEENFPVFTHQIELSPLRKWWHSR